MISIENVTKKYITKNLENCVKEVGAHMYYCSRGLKRAVEIKRGVLKVRDAPWDYENDWVKIKWLDGKIDPDKYIE